MPVTFSNISFTDYRARSLDYLKANAGDYMQKFSYDVKIDFAINFDVKVFFQKSGSNFYLSSGNWDGYGFVAGQSISIFGVVSGAAKTATISSIDGGLMILTGGSFASIPDGYYYQGTIRCSDVPHAIDFRFNLVPDNAAQNELSLIDGEAQRFRLERISTALPSVGSTATMVRMGKSSGGSNMDLTIERLPASLTGHDYRITSPFRLWIVNDETPYQSINQLKPYVRCIALPSATEKAFIDASNVGLSDTGYKDESFNQGVPKYNFTSIAWTDASSTPLDGWDHTQESRFTIRIDRESGYTDFSGSHLFNVFMFNVPEVDIHYKNLYSAHENNINMVSSESPLPVGVTATVSGYPSLDGAQMDILDFTVTNNTDHVIITGRCVPNAAFITRYNNRDVKNRFFKLWIRCEAPSLAYDLSDSVHVECYAANSIPVPQPLGNYPDLTAFTFEDHNETTLGYVPITEDDLLARARFTLPKNGLALQHKQFAIRLIMRNSVTNEEFILEEQEIWLSGTPVIGDGTRPFDYQIATNFILPIQSDKRYYILQRDATLDTGSDYGVEFIYPFLLRWEEWFAQANASDDFFGSKNKDYRHYDISTNWDFICQFGILTPDGEYLDEINFTGDIRDYNDWSHSSVLNYYRLDGTPLSNPITGEQIRIEAVHKLTAETWNGNEWGQITIENFEGSPRYLISSEFKFIDALNSPFDPLAGFDRLKKTVTSDTVTLECLYTATKVKTGNEVSVGTRVNGDTTGSGIQNNRIKDKETVSPKPIDSDEPDRGFDKDCCEPFLTLVDLVSTASERNDVNSAWDRGDSVTFRVMKEDGTVSSYTPTSIEFPNDPNAWYCTVQWRDVALLDGYGCYTIEYDVSYGGIVETKLWGEYDVQPYLIGTYRNCEGTVRLNSIFNDNNQLVGIDFTDAFVNDTLRFKGKFGYFKPNTEVDNIQYVDDTKKKIRREDLFEYELRADLHRREVVEKLLFHLVAENSLWITDENRDNFKYYVEHPVIVSEGFDPTFFDGTRRIKGIAKFKDKESKRRTNFRNNGIEAEYLTPPVIQNQVTIKGYFAAGESSMPQLTIDGDNAGTFTSLASNNVGSLTFSINGGSFVAFSAPMVLNVGDTLDVNRTSTISAGWYKLTGYLE